MLRPVTGVVEVEGLTKVFRVPEREAGRRHRRLDVNVRGGR
jgi:hypothetical protein